MRYLIVTETPFSPKMHYVFWQLVSDCGILREHATLTSLLEDVPAEGKHGATTPQLTRLMPAIRERLTGLRGTILIPMGGTVFRTLTGLDWKIDSARGYVIPPSMCRPGRGRAQVQVGQYARDNKAKSIKAGDPKFALRVVEVPACLPSGCEAIVPSISLESVIKMRMKTLSAFECTFKNAVRFANGEKTLEMQTWTDGIPTLGSTDWRGVVSYDLEAPFGSTTIERASLCSVQGVWSFPWDSDAVQVVRTALETASLRVAHNQQYDIPILAAHGISTPEPTFDTMLAASLLEPDLPKGLDAVTPLYLLSSPWKHLAKERGFADPEYSAKDAFIERHLALALQKRLEDTGMDHLFNEVMMPAVPVLMDMKQQGIKLDRAAVDKWCDTLTTQLGDGLFKWGALYPTVNPFSPPQLKAFIKTWGITLNSTNEVQLSKLRSKLPSHRDDINLLLSLRETKKLLSTYGKTALGLDRVHPSYLPAGKDTKAEGGKGLAATGRLATSNPNIQNQPKSARMMYIPDSPDMCFVEFDWSQAELRVAAALSGDLHLQKALDGDVHDTTMRLLSLTGETGRRLAKNVIFCSSYGGGPEKVWETLLAAGTDISKEECKQLQNNLAKAYPVWWAWRWKLVEQADVQQYLRNPFGRIRHFPMGAKDVPAIMNTIPQSTIGDAAWYCYRAVWEECRRWGGRLTTVVHDSFVTQVHSRVVNPFIVAVTSHLEHTFDCIKPGFYLPIEVKMGAPGASWANLKENGWKTADAPSMASSAVDALVK